MLSAISEGSLSRTVTIKGGIAIRSLTKNNRKATKDIDLDFIHYPLNAEAIKMFVERLDCLPDMKLELVSEIEGLKY